MKMADLFNSMIKFFWFIADLWKSCVDGNQTILVWLDSTSKRRHIRDMGPELEALVTFAASHKSAMNSFFHHSPESFEWAWL